MPEAVLDATGDDVPAVETQSSENNTGEQQSSLSTMAENEVEVVYSDNESDEEVFLDNPMISQQIRRSLSSQFTRSTVKCATQTQPAVNTTQWPSVTPQNSRNKQNINISKPLVKQQMPVNNRLPTSLSNAFNNTLTNSDRFSIPGTSFQSSTLGPSVVQSKLSGTLLNSNTPGTSFQNSSSLFSNSSESKKPSLFSKSLNEQTKTDVTHYSSTVERKKSFDDNIVHDIDAIESDDIDFKNTVEIFGSVQKLSSKLRIVQSEWVLTACISDGSRTFDAKFSSQVSSGVCVCVFLLIHVFCVEQ